MIKNGGNVVSYFCTHEGRLIHAVGGPVDGDKLLSEAKWALQLAQDMQTQPSQSKADFVREAHENASQPVSRTGHANSWNRGDRSAQSHIHRLLVPYAYLPMSQVESKLFRALSGEKFESNRTQILDASEVFTRAEKRDRPVLLVLRNHLHVNSPQSRWQRTSPVASVFNNYKVKQQLNKFEVASLPKIQLAAFTNLRELRGWEELATQAGSHCRTETTYLVVHPSGKIVAQVTPTQPAAFLSQLESAYEKHLEESTKTSPKLASSF